MALFRILLLGSCLLVTIQCAWADFPMPVSAQATTPYAPVHMTAYVYEQPRPLRCWVVRIDLMHPDIEFIVTPQTTVDAGWTTACATTLDFAKLQHVQLAINASPFSPFRQKTGEPMKINGLHMTQGQMLSPPLEKTGQGAMLIAPDQQVKLMDYPIAPSVLQQARQGVGGFAMVLREGKNLLVKEKASPPPKHPRTAVGLSEKGKYLWWLVVDGRQPGKSEGLTYHELGEWALSLGVTDLLNLDGGGSTTLVLQDPSSREHRVVNVPVGKGPAGSLRLNGNNLGLRIYSQPVDMTLSQLQGIMPHLKREKARLFLGPLNRAMAEHQINTPLRRAAFLAQLAHESGELRYMEEIASGEAYEGRASLGNIQPGDGKRYKGRGPIQLTGRSNYRQAGQSLGLDLEARPEQVTDPDIGCRVAGWFWSKHQLNQPADANDFKLITRKINGGYHGMEQRERYYAKAKEVLGVK